MSSLTARLEALRQRYAGIKPEIAEKIGRHIADLRQPEHADRVLKVGDRAPAFTLKDQHDKVVSSTDLLARGPLVVSFFRGSWCPYCVEEMNALAESYDAVRAAGADVVVITPQSSANARGYYADHHVPFPVLVDPDAEIAEKFGLAYTFSDDLKDLYLDVFSNDLEVVNAAHSWRLPIPGRFVISTAGVIIDAQADPDYRFRPEPEEVLAVLDRVRATAVKAEAR